MCWRSGNLLFRGLANKILASSACSLMMKALFRRDGFLRRSVSAENSEGPWLPQDIMMQIFSLLEIPDLVRAGSVCASWRAAYTSLCTTAHSKLQETPCLLYTSESIGDRAMGLYSLAEKKAYTLTVPDPPIRSREVIGSSYGWIITADERSELQLLNPISGDQIALPSVTTIGQVEPIYDDAGTLCQYEYTRYAADWISETPPEILDLNALRDYLFYKAFLSSDPSTGDYIVVLIHLPDYQLSFARGGDVEWTWLPPHTMYEDCQFQGSLLYATTALGEIHMYDLGAPAVARKIILDKVKRSVYERIYIVQAPSGELLQIKRSDDECEHDAILELSKVPKNTTSIQVHKVDLTSEKNLVEVDTLCENVLFIGRNQSLCLCAKEYPQLLPNHAYLTDDDYLDVSCFKDRRRDIGEFDLENNRIKEIVSPQLWSNSPTPVWLVPNPRRMSRLASHS
ncbi:hypothetical protein HU200_005724 [Digitaria exilis]|uniref:F-box domain-containing protein n=1 Tax=Digitaria exilis TaxID=1010633 RepID=A0A835BPE5_9POAL|nr:hypothetical protein HU200_038114 [Digitaria exilis]KAF8694586.1 hypothetical protein HU200_038115 [Digitaria exilis]KAF8772471.1 hypothetical protein HU200_005724 [Digitaria exilis]